jgi:WD40 repeat protein
LKDPRRNSVMALSADGKILAAGDRGGLRQIRFWDLESQEELPAESGHLRCLDLLAFAADEQTLVTSDRTQLLQWDTRNSEPRTRCSWHVKGAEDPVLSPNGQLVATGWGKSVEIMPVSTGKSQRTLTYQGDDCIRLVAFAATAST